MKRAIPFRTRQAAKEIGQSIGDWRRMQNLKSEELADMAGVSRSTLSRLENGDPSVSLATLLNICNVFAVMDRVIDAVDPYETDYGRARASQELPQRVRRAR
ncbi:helix-turn-helix transcriptional regulator [Caniella muris]|uniref:helix-turn-helix transcriptional regulator n=1 Tax=Caniella muris TaxID=2941502 RepID=UPI00203BC798|nr:helix-turn-helix transcriptional regulator [Caniella muris]